MGLRGPFQLTEEEFSKAALTMYSQTMLLLLWVMERRMVWITGQSRTPGAPVGGKRVISGSKGVLKCVVWAMRLFMSSVGSRGAPPLPPLPQHLQQLQQQLPRVEVTTLGLTTMMNIMDNLSL